MPERNSDNSAEPVHRAKGNYLENEDCKVIQEIYQTIHASTLENFSVSLIESLLNELRAVLFHLERLPEVAFKELIAVVLGLSEARNELRLARFLFDAEEIDPIRRLLLRNKAVLRGKTILHKILCIWPLYNSPHE